MDGVDEEVEVSAAAFDDPFDEQRAGVCGVRRSLIRRAEAATPRCGGQELEVDVAGLVVVAGHIVERLAGVVIADAVVLGPLQPHSIRVTRQWASWFMSDSCLRTPATLHDGTLPPPVDTPTDRGRRSLCGRTCRTNDSRSTATTAEVPNPGLAPGRSASGSDTTRPSTRLGCWP